VTIVTYGSANDQCAHAARPLISSSKTETCWFISVQLFHFVCTFTLLVVWLKGNMGNVILPNIFGREHQLISGQGNGDTVAVPEIGLQRNGKSSPLDI